MLWWDASMTSPSSRRLIGWLTACWFTCESVCVSDYDVYRFRNAGIDWLTELRFSRATPMSLFPWWNVNDWKVVYRIPSDGLLYPRVFKRLVTPLNNRRYINYFNYLSIYPVHYSESFSNQWCGDCLVEHDSTKLELHHLHVLHCRCVSIAKDPPRICVERTLSHL